MIDIKKLKPGMTVWDVRKAKRRIHTGHYWDTFPVHIESVDLDAGTCLSSWNGNKATVRFARGGKFSWREKKPTGKPKS